MDALSQVLSSLHMEASILSHFVLGAPWGLHCPRHPGVPFYAVIDGGGWLWSEGGKPLAMVAEELGYRSSFAFARCFRRVHGVAPGRYRRQRPAAA